MKSASRSVLVTVVAVIASVALGCTPPAGGDTTKPVLDVPDSIALEASSPGGAAVTFAATATDNVSGSVPVTCIPPSGSLFPVGVTTVSCEASDLAGNTATGSFTVTVTDTTPPQLFLPASLTAVNPGPSGVNVSYTANAVDNVSGAVPIHCAPPSGSLFSIGSTTVNCSASDALGNTATGTFTVTVLDTTAPVLSLANVDAEATGPSGATVAYTASAFDAVDGAVPVDCVAPSGTAFPLGATNVKCTATDSAGNGAIATFTVTVADTTAPVLSLPEDLTREGNELGGGYVGYTATATDAVDGAVSPTCDLEVASFLPVGVTTTVTCSATDTAGNTATGSFTITVVDTTPPSIQGVQNIDGVAVGLDPVPISYDLTASDIVDGDVPVTCVPPSGSLFPLGVTTVSCSAADAAGNTSATESFDVTVATRACNAGRLVINEIDYEQPATSDFSGVDDREFVEICNGTDHPIDMADLSLRFIDGAATPIPQEYLRVQLGSAGVLPAGGYLLVLSPTFPTSEIPDWVLPAPMVYFPSSTDNIQNGDPSSIEEASDGNGDGVVLVDDSDSQVLDGMSYEGEIPLASITGRPDPVPVTEGEWFPWNDLVDYELGWGGYYRTLIRWPNGSDTDQTAYVDWGASSYDTPGYDNTCRFQNCTVPPTP
jgi:hypothetical protein